MARKVARLCEITASNVNRWRRLATHSNKSSLAKNKKINEKYKVQQHTVIIILESNNNNNNEQL